MQEQEQEFSFKNLFFPLTNTKVIIWIVIIGFIVFFNMLFNNFVEDDLKYIINYPPVHQINLAVLFGPNDFNKGGQYRPLPATYFAILFSLFNSIPFFYHIIQLVLHTAVTFLIYLLFKKFIPKSTALLFSLLFLIHPMNVESVSYIAQTVSPIFTLFGLIAFFLLTKEKISTKNYIIGYFLLLLSILNKETGVIFIFLIFLYYYLFFKKINLKELT